MGAAMHRTVFLLAFLLSCGGETSSNDVGKEAGPGDVRADSAPFLADATGELEAPDLPEPADVPDSSDLQQWWDAVDASADLDASVEVDAGPEGDVQAAVPPEHIWSQSFGSSGAEEAVSVAVGSDGTIFLAGNYHSNYLDLGGGLLENNSTLGMRDAFVAAFDSSGTHLWSVSFGGEDDDVMYSLALSEAGEIYVTGYFRSDSIDFGFGPQQSAGKMDLFLVKLSSAGAPIWARTFGGELDDATFSVGVDSGGAVYVTGYFSSVSLDLGGEPMENVSVPGYHDIFAARFSEDGDHVWSKRFGGSSWERSTCPCGAAGVPRHVCLWFVPGRGPLVVPCLRWVFLGNGKGAVG